MLFYLFLGFMLLVAAVALMAAYARADPAALARELRWGAVALAGIGLVLLPVIGRGSLLALGPALILPLLSRLLMRYVHRGFGAGPRPGQSSAVETAWLAMTLDHDSGTMTGRVRAGRFAGRDLASLDPDEILELLDECRGADPDSVPLIEAFLDRMHGPGWREAAAGTGGGHDGAHSAGRGGMSRDEAYEILGLAPGAGPAAIKEAHRALMQKLHPDRGGSTYLAAKINQAKDLLLGN